MEVASDGDVGSADGEEDADEIGISRQLQRAAEELRDGSDTDTDDDVLLVFGDLPAEATLRVS